MLRITHHLLIAILVVTSSLAFSQEIEQWQTLLSAGVDSRQQGRLPQSIEQLTKAKQEARTNQDQMRATGELGATLIQSRRLEQAEGLLREAYLFFSGSERARYALDLGNLAVLLKRGNDAQAYYEEALKLSDFGTEIHASAGLNLARLSSEQQRLKTLAALYQEIGKTENATTRARLYLNLGNQARMLGKPAVELAYVSLNQAQQLLGNQQVASDRLYVETLDALAQLYEDQGRYEDALKLTQRAVKQTHSLVPVEIGDLLISLEWRQGRLQKIFKNSELALAAYRRAVDQIEMLRQDIPIDYEDGRSSFRNTLEPIYMGLIELLLLESEGQSGDAQTAYLRRAKNTVELIKQSELQDYLGDRCTVEAIKGDSATVIPDKTAILYPIIFSDRIELLLETKKGIFRFSTQIPAATIRQTAIDFADNLRNGEDGYLLRSKQLYNWIIRPFETLVAEQHIETLVVVPDGALRLVAMGALHDGKTFAIEKFAVTTVTGLSMTNTNAPPKRQMGFLVAGVSEPGSVVEKLNQSTVDQIFGSGTADSTTRALSKHRAMRSFRFISANSMANVNVDSATRSVALREALSLPGVKQEIEAIGRIMPSTSLLNSGFTLKGFSHEAESGDYRIVHIASHGVFGGSAETSYILAYDDLLTLNGLQSLLKSDHFRKNPIELLSLSACETAEGDERSPLGISGAAIKARAKSVLGTLWPVEDNAARKMMEKFYQGLAKDHLSKAEALRQSQVELLHNEEFSHPIFWAPFVLIGNWL